MAARSVNYYQESLVDYKKIRAKNGNKKPKLLLHVCCGACSCYPLIFLSDLFDVTIFFSNSNITPFSEYEKRLEALTNYVGVVNKKLNQKISIIVDNYDYENHRKFLLPFKDEKEGQNRCKICITKRLERLFIFAKVNGFENVTTVMSISRNKDAKFLNEEGQILEKKYGVHYFISNFKKENGQEYGIALSKYFNVYRQEYCGCEFSNIEQKF